MICVYPCEYCHEHIGVIYPELWDIVVRDWKKLENSICLFAIHSIELFVRRNTNTCESPVKNLYQMEVIYYFILWKFLCVQYTRISPNITTLISDTLFEWNCSWLLLKRNSWNSSNNFKRHDWRSWTFHPKESNN